MDWNQGECCIRVVVICSAYRVPEFKTLSYLYLSLITQILCRSCIYIECEWLDHSAGDHLSQSRGMKMHPSLHSYKIICFSEWADRKFHWRAWLVWIYLNRAGHCIRFKRQWSSKKIFWTRLAAVIGLNFCILRYMIVLDKDGFFASSLLTPKVVSSIFDSDTTWDVKEIHLYRLGTTFGDVLRWWLRVRAMHLTFVFVLHLPTSDRWSLVRVPGFPYH